MNIAKKNAKLTLTYDAILTNLRRMGYNKIVSILKAVEGK